MFGRKKKTEKKSFDREKLSPAMRSSICTGEKVAGFRNKETGKFEEVMMIRNEEDLAEFEETYGIRPDEIKIFY